MRPHDRREHQRGRADRRRRGLQAAGGHVGFGDRKLAIIGTLLKKQKGSSAMPRGATRWRGGQIPGLAGVVRGNLQAALENIPVERMILPSSLS